MKENDVCESCKKIRIKNGNRIDQCESCLRIAERRLNWFRNVYVRDIENYDNEF